MKTKRFSEQLKFYRERKGLSKSLLSKLVGTSCSYFRQLENQNYRPPTLIICKKLASVFELSDLENMHFLEAAFEERLSKEQEFYLEIQRLNQKLISKRQVLV